MALPQDTTGEPRQVAREFERVVGPMLSEYCIKCHIQDERESGIRLDHLDGTLQESTLRLWEEAREQIADDAMPPEDEPQPSGKQRRAIIEWIDGGIEMARARAIARNGMVRRLTVNQYRNTLRDLLGVDEDFAGILPPDGISKDGFTNDAKVMLTSPLQVEAWFGIAEKALDAVMVNESVRPSIQNFRMDLGKGINPEPLSEKLILGANDLLLANPDFLVTQLVPKKSFDFEPFRMRTKYRFHEGYQGNGTVRGWREYGSIYHAVFACMRGDRGYPKGMPYETIPAGLLLRPAIPIGEHPGDSRRYGPKANFKIALRELPEQGRFRVKVRAAKYDDGLLLLSLPVSPAELEHSSDQIVLDEMVAKPIRSSEEPGSPGRSSPSLPTTRPPMCRS